MTSSTVLNLVVAIGAVALLIAVLRAAYLAAGGSPEELRGEDAATAGYDLERAA